MPTEGFAAESTVRQHPHPGFDFDRPETGGINSAADRDLDGVVFGDIPWVLSNDTEHASLRDRMQKAWPESVATYTRLYAFGADAYTIIPHLERLRLHRFAEFQGQTGRLSIDDANRVNRQLIWARFTAGTPRLVRKERRGL